MTALCRSTAARASESEPDRVLFSRALDPRLGEGRRLPGKPVVADMPKKAEDGTTVQRKTYGPGKDGAEVVLFVINGGGHTWPGRDP